MHKWVVISLIPVGQTVSTDWDRQTTWLENPSADRREEAPIVARRSDSMPWPASWSAVIQCQALQWKWHFGNIALYHWFVVPWSCGPVMISTTFLFFHPTFRKAQIWKWKSIIGFVFFFLILWNSGLFCSCLTLWKTSARHLCVQPFPHILEKVQP